MASFTCKPTLNWEGPLIRYSATRFPSPYSSSQFAARRCLFRMDADPAASYPPLTDGSATAPGKQSTGSAMVGLGLNAPRHAWLQAPRSYPDGNIEYYQSSPDLQRPYFGGSHCYPPSYVEQEGHRMVPFSVAQSAVSGCSSPSFATSTPYVPSYHLISNIPLRKWQSMASIHQSTPLYGLYTPVRYTEPAFTPALTLCGQNTFSPTEVDNISPVEFEPQASQRSFASSWSNCPTPQALLHSHRSHTPELKTESEPADFSHRNSILESHSPETCRSSETPRTLSSRHHLLIALQGRKNLNAIVAIRHLNEIRISSITVPPMSRAENPSLAKKLVVPEHLIDAQI